MDVGTILHDRNRTHGDIDDVCNIAQGLKSILKSGKTYGCLTSTQAEILDMIAHKLARLVSGDAHYADHWLDVEGYARCARERTPSQNRTQ